ncbi:MAG: hypothetical protein K0R67_2024 [Paenibacillus sp.]|jgi:hypothetical protein|nr:hypothetical protein [Paenibacillus sp.]
MKEIFIVKNAVGGPIFIDTGKQPVDYKVEELEGGGASFTVKGLSNVVVEGILQSKDELNVFIFREYEDRPTVKTWYYVHEGPVAFDDSRDILTIVTQSSIAYVPDEYMTDMKR